MRLKKIPVALAALAGLTIIDGSRAVQAIALVAGGALVVSLLWSFARAATPMPDPPRQ